MVPEWFLCLLMSRLSYFCITLLLLEFFLPILCTVSHVCCVMNSTKNKPRRNDHFYSSSQNVLSDVIQRTCCALPETWEDIYTSNILLTYNMFSLNKNVTFTVQSSIKILMTSLYKNMNHKFVDLSSFIFYPKLI
jgi:hypothetical protein